MSWNIIAHNTIHDSRTSESEVGGAAFAISNIIIIISSRKVEPADNDLQVDLYRESDPNSVVGIQNSKRRKHVPREWDMKPTKLDKYLPTIGYMTGNPFVIIGFYCAHYNIILCGCTRTMTNIISVSFYIIIILGAYIMLYRDRSLLYHKPGERGFNVISMFFMIIILGISHNIIL